MSELNVKETIEFVREANRAQKEALERRRELEGLVEKSVEKAIKDAGFKYKMRVYILGGGSEWTPEASINPHFYGVRHSHSSHTNKELFFHYVGDGGFMWSEDPHKVYPNPSINNLPAPYDTEKLFEVCKSQSEVLGVPVNIHVSPVITELKGNPYYTLDLLVLHPKGEVAHEGEITYHGWDCQDKWAIVCDPDTGDHFYYGSTGHGGGMNNHIAPGEWESFLSFLSFAEGSDVCVDSLDFIKTFFNL